MSIKRFAVDLLPFAVSAERSAVNALKVRITATNASIEPPARHCKCPSLFVDDENSRSSALLCGGILSSGM